MPMGLEPAQARSRRRRDALLTAALELIAEGGARAVTHRAVAARAGLPAATTTYFFDSIQQLVEAALRRHVSDRVTELEGLAMDAIRGGRSAEQVATRFAASLAERSREATSAQFEVYLEAARNPAMREPVAQALAAFERLAELALGTLGAKRPAEAAAAFVCLIDGFALHKLARPRGDEAETDALFEAMRALFISQIIDEDELERLHERLRQPLHA
jgi:TetR/AcrR family transcriptional regulator, regulator of biofilm formation and stress response